MENILESLKGKPFTGRRKMLTSLLPLSLIGNNFGAVILDEETLAEDLSDQMQIHLRNSLECQYLLNYYRGNQQILYRCDENRTNDNHTVINFANAISRNIASYTYSGGIQYVTDDQKFSDDVRKINNYMKRENKDTVSKEVQDYQSICGHAFMAIMPDAVNKNDVPFELLFLSPVDTFVVYSSFNTNEPVYGCHYFTVRRDGKDVTIYQVYTKTQIFLYRKDSADSMHLEDGFPKPNALNAVPIVEFPNNAFRLGDFEVALTLLDSINSLTSDCLYNIQSVVTSYLCIFGVDPGSVDFDSLKENRVMVFNGVPGINQGANFIYTQLDGSSTELLRNYLESALKFIVGVPDRDAGQTGSDTGAAAELRTGQGDIEVTAQTKALYAARAERQILDIAIRILQPEYISTELRSSDISVEITRINRADMLTKSQAMLNLKQLGMVEEDIIHFGSITNDESGVARRMRENIQKQNAASVAQKATNEIVVENE